MRDEGAAAVVQGWSDVEARSLAVVVIKDDLRAAICLAKVVLHTRDFVVYVNLMLAEVRDTCRPELDGDRTQQICRCEGHYARSIVPI